MPTYAYPGVYVEEISSGVRPIEAAGTSTAAFFGVAECGPIGQVKKIFNFTEFQNTYGPFLEGHYLAHAVFQFFNNGGTQCYIGRVAKDAQTASVTIKDQSDKPQQGQDGLTIQASTPGQWGNRLKAMIDGSKAEDPDNQFNLIVYQDDPDPDEGPVEVESFANLSLNPSSSNYVETVINSRSKYIRVKANPDNPNYINGYSLGGEIKTTAIGLAEGQSKFRINIHDDGFQTVDLAGAIKGQEKKLDVIANAIQTKIQALKPLHASIPRDAYNVSVEVVDKKRLKITSGLKHKSSKVEILNAENTQEDIAALLSLGKANGGQEIYGSAPLRPQEKPAKAYYLLGQDKVEGPVSAVKAGNDGNEPDDQDYINALSWLDAVTDVSLIAVPGIGSAAVADGVMNYCRNRPLSDCFHIADMAITDDNPDAAGTYRGRINSPNSYGAVYFPWLKMLDPLGRSAEPVLVPPSGFVAGMYAKIDARRGVWKAPAGTEALLGGAVGLAYSLTDIQQGILNQDPKSICAVRQFSSAGIVLWGARTLSADPEYKYIPVRRTAIMLRKSIYNGIQWAVFEPNDEDLWAQLRLNIRSFMMNLFRQGAFQGAKPSEAFFVKCDNETTTQGDIDLGIVNVLIGFAPLKPAEFVVVKISQKAGQSS